MNRHPPLGRFRNNPAFMIAVAALATVATLVYHRLHFGVSVGDESLYVALPYRFVLGDRPFKDELILLQLSSALLYPWIKLYCWFTGGSEGIVLFARQLHFTFTLIVAGVAFFLLRQIVETAQALLIALSLVLFVPFNQHSLSYNSLGSGWFAIGLCVGALGLRDAAPALLVLAGLAHGLAVLSYPTLITALLVYATICLAVGRARLLFAYVGGGLLVGAPLVAYLGWVGWVGAQSVQSWLAYNWMLHPPADGAGVKKIASGFLHCLLGHPPLLLWGLAMYLMPARRGWWLLATPLACVPLWCFRSYQLPMGFVLLYSVAALVLSPLLRGDRDVAPLFVRIVAPALVAGGSAAFFSHNSLASAPIGLAPIVLVGSAAIARFLVRQPLPKFRGLAPVLSLLLMTGTFVMLGETPSQARELMVSLRQFDPFSAIGHLSRVAVAQPLAWLLLALAIVAIRQIRQSTMRPPVQVEDAPGSGADLLLLTLVLVTQLGVFFVGFYEEPGFSRLTAAVRSGPFRGLYTTPERRDHLETLQAALTAVARPNDTVLFFGCFPAGYLMSSLRPITPSVYTFSDGPYGTLAYYRARQRFPDLVVKTDLSPCSNDAGLQELLEAGDYTPEASGIGYWILRLSPSRASPR